MLLSGMAATPLLSIGGRALAQDWNPFRENTASLARTDSYDREFVRGWEANPVRGYPTISPANIEATRAAIRRYESIVQAGGWPVVPDTQMEQGSSGPAVAVLRQRLRIPGHILSGPGGSFFDKDVYDGVRRFQASNGLSPTGIADRRTIAALNISAQTRLKQLQSNLPRILELSKSAPKKYIIVNIPAAQIEAVDNNAVVSRHAGVVGKIDRPTPILRSAVHELNFNPVWHLPPTVIEKDLIPKGREMQRAGKSVLTQYGIDAYDGTGRKLDPSRIDWSSPSARNISFKQQPGKENPLGFVKINFHNQYSVYMHDTPSDGVFGRNFRAASSGCVRVSGIEQLAAWILAENGDWSVPRVMEMKQTGGRQDVKVRRPIPLYFAYITAWATEDGVIQFRRDLYQKDGIGEVASAY